MKKSTNPPSRFNYPLLDYLEREIFRGSFTQERPFRRRLTRRNQLQQVEFVMSGEPSDGSDVRDPVDMVPGDRVANHDNRSATAMAAEWASRIMTISLEMVLPGLVGYWLDNRLGTKGLFMLLGFAAGSWIAFKQLLAIAKQGQTRRSSGRSHSNQIPPNMKEELLEKDKL